MKTNASTKSLKLTKTHDYVASEHSKAVAIFIHGIASDSSTFAHALEYLESKSSLSEVRFVAFDLLGSGKSYKDNSLNYDYNEQIEALHRAIEKLDLDVPMILVGHSMGTLIVTRYANNYPDGIKELVLLSPPIYTVSDLEDASFATGIKFFKDAVSLKNREILEEKSFNNSMEKIVLDKKNYENLASLKIPTTLIYGDIDQFIGAHNIPEILKKNPNLSAIKTIGRHGVSRDKYTKLEKILEGIINDEII